ncbi:MAG: class I SAM-dependent methyltransferase [Syntrophobacterales bacterium]|nr:class I SAM-dependent methyltransferase [Syntrophobacterales bacterium]
MQRKIITVDRWRQAQEVEEKYWERVKNDAAEFMRIIYEKYHFIHSINQHYPEALVPPNGRPGEALEIGIGSLGIAVALILEPPEAWNTTGVDPQPKSNPGRLPMPLLAFYEKLMQRNLTYVQTCAENLPFNSNHFDLVVCYNVLDHTHNPYAILKEIYRVLQPGGYFLLGLDALSLASWLRHRLFIEDIAHPYKFLPWQVERLLPAHGFQLLYFTKDKNELCRRIIGKARRLIAVGRKPGNK